MIDVLTRLTVLLFTIYSLLVCPKDVNLESPVCRGLTVYRERILDPYILPPIRAAAAHPLVAPQIARAKPYVNDAITFATVQYTTLYHKAEVVSRPYLVQATREYNKRLRPHVRLMEYNIRRYRRQAQPYVDQARGVVLDLWIKSEPYVTPVLIKLQEAPALAKEFVSKPLGEARERWVDPQLKKIVDKVEEMSANVSEEDKVLVEDAEPTGTEDATFAAPIPEHEYPPVTYYSSAQDAMTTSAFQAVTNSAVEEAAPTPVEDVLAGSTETDGAEALPTPTTITEAEETPIDLDTPIYNPNYEEDIEDLEFWDEFDEWLHESVLVPGGTTAANVAPAATPLSAEEKAEKKRKEQEETAAKRADILKRHDEYEYGLVALIESEATKLFNSLEENRKKALGDLTADSMSARKLATGLKEELEAAIQSTAAVLKNLEESAEKKSEENADSDTPDFMEKLPVWAQVLEQVEMKFGGKVDALNAEMASWVSAWVQGEGDMVRYSDK